MGMLSYRLCKTSANTDRKMKKQTAIKLFEQNEVRTHWDDDAEKWYFSIVDVIRVLMESPRPRKYWNALKTKLNDEGSELSQNLGQLKMQSSDGKFYKTDVADVAREQLEKNTGKKVISSLNAIELHKKLNE